MIAAHGCPHHIMRLRRKERSGGRKGRRRRESPISITGTRFASARIPYSISGVGVCHSLCDDNRQYCIRLHEECASLAVQRRWLLGILLPANSDICHLSLVHEGNCGGSVYSSQGGCSMRLFLHLFSRPRFDRIVSQVLCLRLGMSGLYLPRE